jgi:ubiquinone biosynthesis protein
MQLQSVAEIPGDVRRAAGIVGVLAKYGLAGWLEGTEWAVVRRALRSHTGQVLTDQPLAVRFRLACSDLGTTFIKLGQVLSTRPELVGPEAAAELSRLQEDTPPDPPDVAVATVERELSRPIGDCFADFDRDPLASASIAQVHRAKLPNGRRVVVKVQHDGIEGTIQRDLAILAKLASLAEGQETLKRYRPSAVVREFRDTLRYELDFRRELRNLVQFRRNFAAGHTVAFPRPYPELSTGRVLTMQMFSGTGVGKVERLKRRHIDLQALARQGAGVFVQMILRDGFYHADPHPGNILVLARGRVGILDAGMVGRLDDQLREQVVEMMLAAEDGDAERFVDVITQVCDAPPDLDRGALVADVAEGLHTYSGQALGRFDVSGALTALTEFLHRYKMFLPSRLSMLIKCLIELEATARGLDADFNLAELLAPYRRQFVTQELSPARLMRKVHRWGHDWQLLAEAIPRRLNALLAQLETGHLAVRRKDPGPEQAVNRLAYGLCASALLLASALLWVHRVPPTIGGVSVLGAAGYLVAALLATRVLWTSRREKRNGD